MSKTYVIRWKSKINGRAGKGSKLFERDEAERLVQELNQEYPAIEHEVLEASEEPEAGEGGSAGTQPPAKGERRRASNGTSHAFSE